MTITILGAGHAAVRWVCNDLVTFETMENVEAIVGRNVRLRDERFVDAVGDLAKRRRRIWFCGT